ncbi:homoserine O-acetyltransferase MetX [Methanorbis rubei]|uniref:Homoserine O-acetyltransferase n=1 Tax=Methanorbis rubei TaxID=3028300 RepID=A0AAE4MEG5_9EURY|nr:Homoserine O-acetyltransferase [Methanocorpusculaceae archaeon Cs1]
MTGGSVGDVVTRYHTLQTPLHLESGAVLNDIVIAYEQYGCSPAHGNTILVCHALSGDAHAAGMHKGDKHPGWWDGVIGPGKALDTDRYCIIATNVIGGCKGSTGPAAINPDTKLPYGPDFPVITIRDMVAAQHTFLIEQEIHDLYAVVGGSMGGMQSLQWSVEYPGFARRIVVIAAAGYSTPMHIAFGAVGRAAIMTDPAWKGGRYSADEKPDRGLSLARMMAHITYLSDQSMHKKFGRRLQEKTEYGYGFETEFSVESYLKHQGRSFVQRFDPNSYLYITKAIDYYDLTKNGSLSEGLKETDAKFLILSVSTDWLYPPYLSEEIVMALNSIGKDVQYTEVMSGFGHDGFLLEDDQMNYLIGRFLTPLTVADIMIRDPPTIRGCATIRAAAATMIEREVNHLPVLHADGTLCGIVTSWDIAKAVAGEHTMLDEIMTKNVLSVSADATLRDAAKILDKYHISALPVVGQGKVVGMLTSEQLSHIAERR